MFGGHNTRVEVDMDDVVLITNEFTNGGRVWLDVEIIINIYSLFYLLGRPFDLPGGKTT